MTLHELPQRVGRIPGLDSAIRSLAARPAHLRIDGIAGVAKSLVVGWTAQSLQRPILLITYQHDQVERACDDLAQLCGPAVAVHPLPLGGRDPMLRSAVDYGALGDRVAALAALARGDACVVVATPEAALQRVAPPSELMAAGVTIERGRAIAVDKLLHSLVAIGYESGTTVNRAGQFSRRGGIIDVFAITAEMPVRIELFGDEVESIRRFDVSTQRSVGSCESETILPVYGFVLSHERASRAVPRVRADWDMLRTALIAGGHAAEAAELDDRMEADVARLREREYFEGIEEYVEWIVPEAACALDYLEAGCRDCAPGLVFVDEPAQVRTHWDRVRQDRARVGRTGAVSGQAPPPAGPGLDDMAARASIVALNALGLPCEMLRDPIELRISSAALESFRNRTEYLQAELGARTTAGSLCVVVTDQPQRTREVLAGLGVEAGSPGGLEIIEGRLRQGFKLDEAGLYVLTDAELYGSTRPVGGKRRSAGGVPISTLLDLRENDYVVHVAHGIGVYRGLVKREVDGAQKDYLYIQYAGADRLYVPADQIDRVQRYIGAEGAKPAINRIGGSEWQRTTRRVKEQARDMARELVQLYAAREAAERPPFGADSPWQAEMEDAFPYEETAGQLRAIADVKSDLEGGKPADRLVCGDVGFGKTEVAIRAAFKVVEAGRQVAVLCPTTVLAAQHHTTFSERLAAYPVRVELLSRFRSKAEQKVTADNLRTGATDIVVGTHRLLSKDVEFRNLGLLVIDEEQRFGVAQKERLKQLRTTVDVLTLTATPIPRTLSMALSGLRDMSVIEEPPGGRLPIDTHVREYDDLLVRDAILREIERGGQVYFVHNRVETIDSVAQRVQRLVPEARIRIGHGQMSEDALERIMHDFYQREYDILVCTTIIENGLDIPNVNTIIVDNADMMGLAQLYQLRGRVGRSSRQAYAYLLVRKGRQLTEEAEQRLFAVREYTALGSGYQIALRDLEIRGAGNLLGSEQSGAMSCVGFDMYCRLLAQAVAEMRGQEYADESLPTADLKVTAHIPTAYIPNEAERIFFYKRLSGAQSDHDVDALQEELEDRYGDPPKPVWNALAVLRLRLRARDAGIDALRHEHQHVTLRFAPDVRLTPRAINLLTHVYRDQRFTSDSVVLSLKSPHVLAEVEEMVDVLGNALRDCRAAPSGATAASANGKG